jgi:hypothetical protein
MATVDIRAQLGLQPMEDLFKYLNMLIYGDWGVGKTELAATAQDCKDMAPVLHLGFEQGLLTIANRKNYDAKEIRTIDELEKSFLILEEDQRAAKPYYKTLVIDNFTELQNLDKDTIMRQTKKTARNPDNVDIDIPSPREWGKLAARLRRVVQGFRDMPIHTIYTAWRGEKTDENGNVILYYPKLQGSLKTEFGGYFDIVGYLNIKMTNNVPTRFLQVVETDRVKAKWRRKLDEIPGAIENPTIPMIWDYVQQSKVSSLKP